jgi:hypothetical protein
MNKLLTKEQFEELCQKHDWTYHMSDDHSKFLAGQRSAAAISSARSLASDFDAIFHRYSTEAYGGAL